jgi:hypothetical protein
VPPVPSPAGPRQRHPERRHSRRTP